MLNTLERLNVSNQTAHEHHIKIPPDPHKTVIYCRIRDTETERTTWGMNDDERRWLKADDCM